MKIISLLLILLFTLTFDFGSAFAALAGGFSVIDEIPFFAENWVFIKRFIGIVVLGTVILNLLAVLIKANKVG